MKKILIFMGMILLTLPAWICLYFVFKIVMLVLNGDVGIGFSDCFDVTLQ